MFKKIQSFALPLFRNFFYSEILWKNLMHTLSIKYNIKWKNARIAFVFLVNTYTFQQ